MRVRKEIALSVFICYMLGVVSVFIGGLATLTRAVAADTLLLTWRAESLIPKEYPGRALPSPGSAITVSAMLVQNGRIVALDGADIRWTVNGIKNPAFTGKSFISFSADPKVGAQTIAVTVGGDQPTGKLISIPLPEPEIAIYPPNRGVIPAGISVFRALPYFFPVSSPGELALTWSVNGATAKPDDEPDILRLDASGMPSGTQIQISCEAKGVQTARGEEKASANQILFIR